MFWLLIFFQSSLIGQDKDKNHLKKKNSYKYYRYYHVEDDDLQPQNWAILQDRRGVIFTANQGGVAEYDGVCWRKLEIPNYIARSLALDEKGTIYVGGKNEIGFLEPDSIGELHYISLLPYIKKDQLDFGNVWKCHSAEKMIYFRTSTFLFGWNPDYKKMHIWKSKTLFNGSFEVEDSLYLLQKNVGLMHLIDNSPELIPGSDTFADKRIYLMASYDEKRILIGTLANGFYLYDGSTFVPFPTEVDDYVKKNRFYHGIRLQRSPGDFALATRLGGGGNYR